MDDITKIDLKRICCTCLSKDRVLFQLCRVKHGVNNLYLLLSFDSEAYREVFFKDTVNLHICWECRTILCKLSKFSRQACDAQKHLTSINNGRHDNYECLSRLSEHHKAEYDLIIFEKDNYCDNFVDCGPVNDIKSESEEDIPLSELHSNFIAYSGTDNQKLKCNKRVKDKYFSKTRESKEVNKSKKIEESFVISEFRCERCVEIFNSKRDLQRHKRSLHNVVERKSTVKRKKNSGCTLKDKRTPFGYLCKECNVYFANKNLRWNHIQRLHKEGYKCTICGKKFAFKNNLTRHEQNHSSPPPRTECQICRKQIRIDLYKVHARIHSPRQQYSCEVCSKHFVSRASYEHHLKYTQAHAAVDVLKHKCSICDKGYRSGGELRDHVNYQHMSKTKHKCPVCGKGLASPRCITRHVRRAHQGVKENARDKICQQCGKAFRDKKGLREHEMIHTGERPLSCEICGCTFRQTASLYTHKKRIHKIYPPAKTLQLLE